MSPQQVARFIVGMSWMYHGLFPKLLQIDPLEKAMTASLGFSDEISYFITKSAGVGELIFGLVFIVFYKSRMIVLLNIAGLIGLLFFVAVLQPNLCLLYTSPSPRDS